MKTQTRTAPDSYRRRIGLAADYPAARWYSVQARNAEIKKIRERLRAGGAA